MSAKKLIPTLIAALVLTASSALAQNRNTQEWDGLQRVPTRNFDAAFLAPGASFGQYTKVMLDQTEVAFDRNWQRDYNRDTRRLDARITDQEAQDILNAVKSGFEDVFAEEYRNAGYEVVTTPGADVLRVRTAVTDIRVTAPDQMNPGRSRTFAEDAGQATIIIEVRDSMSGAILGRGVDRRAAGDNDFMLQRSRATNRGDFRRLFQAWARQSAAALTKLRTESAPVAAGQP